MEFVSHPNLYIIKFGIGAISIAEYSCILSLTAVPMLVLTCVQMKAGREDAAACANLWLEKTAFFKVPRALQDETAETHQRPLEDVSRFQACTQSAEAMSFRRQHPSPGAGPFGCQDCLFSVPLLLTSHTGTMDESCYPTNFWLNSDDQCV